MNMRPQDLDYSLPPELIAQEPAAARSRARMLVVGPPHRLGHAADLPRFLPDGALVILNESRVVPARLFARRKDRRFELLVCEPAPLGAGDEVRAWVRGAKRLEADDLLEAAGVTLRYVGCDDLDPRARIFVIESGGLLAALAAEGEVPLPPYIRRPEGPTDDDSARYQTVYAARGDEEAGSVAAPTAGLHFDADLLRQVDSVRIRLHVGPGTFLPMEVEDVREHRVGAERFDISEFAANRIRNARSEGRAVVAVGTTVTRALETVAQRHGDIVAGSGRTELVITPGFHFRVVDNLLTNFHLPQSSLLMLVCAFAGRDRTLDAYRLAVRERMRFYSYGDCMLVDRGSAGAT